MTTWTQRVKNDGPFPISVQAQDGRWTEVLPGQTIKTKVRKIFHGDRAANYSVDSADDGEAADQ